VKSVYDLGSTPVDLQGLIESEWFVVGWFWFWGF